MDRRKQDGSVDACGESLNFDVGNKDDIIQSLFSRDYGARETYRNEIRKDRSYKDDIFVLDILREEMKNDDSRIQRILSI